MSRRDGRVELDRGLFVEAYELAIDTVEQLFVFDALDGDGDLELSIPADTEMTARESGDGIEFENAHGRVVYGRAIAIDAAGRRVDAPTELVDGAIVIRVADGFLDSAAFPLTIDPLITNVVVDSTIGNNLEADVAFDLVAGRWIVVYEQVFSESDHGVLSKAFSADGSTQLALAYVDLTASDWRRPRCANNRLGASWLVVGQRNGSEVMGRIVYAATHAMDPQFMIAVNAVMPDVAGDSYPFSFPGSVYVVVYTRMTTDLDWDIVFRGVGPTGGVGNDEWPVAVSPNFDRAPSISKSHGAGGWMVTWLRDTTSGTSYVHAARSGINGDLSMPPTLLAGPGVLSFPEVSSGMRQEGTSTPQNLVVYQKQTSPGDNDAMMVLVEGNTPIWNVNLGQLENQGAFDTSDQLYPSVDTDDDHFVVVYSDEYNQTGNDYDVYAQDVYVSGTTLGLVGGRTTLAFSGSAELFPRIAARRGSGDTDPVLGRRYFAVWDDNRNSSNGNIEGAIVASVPGGAIQPSCFGDGTAGACPCGNSGSAGHGCAHSFSAAGAQLAGSGFVSTVQDTFRLDATNLPPASNQVTFFQGTAGSTSSAFGDGLRCANGTVLRIATVVSSAGAAAYGGSAGGEPISVRGAVPPAGATRHYQASYRNSAVFCTSATFNITNGVRGIWAP